MQKIAVLDYGMGNLHSVAKALEKVSTNQKIFISKDIKKIQASSKIVIPGVGAIRDCMNSLVSLGMDDLIRKFSEEKPILGICVGMQLLLQGSEENNGTKCLGLLDGISEKLKSDRGIKVPHMGWNRVSQKLNHPMFKGISQDSFFYFVHSYAALKSENQASITNHGQDFVSSICKENIFAVQFHPEKSQYEGLKIYKNFIFWEGGDTQ
ncbi:MAG: imidazole glycerol phosphate synthase subunit HisH [Candidatus Marinimicrobia bacterium]|nr:imidazole glycerol phosphate synthase subunit HisH [Candidatus Neomarinimicrobiota bacterium]|tara:strand:+ start:378 stop:1004 length:627 start_codon:yes stop_codon:yes gene_type:complete